MQKLDDFFTNQSLKRCTSLKLCKDNRIKKGPGHKTVDIKDTYFIGHIRQFSHNKISSTMGIGRLSPFFEYLKDLAWFGPPGLISPLRGFFDSVEFCRRCIYNTRRSAWQNYLISPKVSEYFIITSRKLFWSPLAVIMSEALSFNRGIAWALLFAKRF